MSKFILGGLTRGQYNLLNKFPAPTADQIWEKISLQQIIAILTVNYAQPAADVDHARAAALLRQKVMTNRGNLKYHRRPADAPQVARGPEGRLRNGLRTYCQSCREPRKIKFKHSGCAHGYLCTKCLKDEVQRLQQERGRAPDNRPITAYRLRCVVCKRTSQMEQVFLSYK